MKIIIFILLSSIVLWASDTVSIATLQWQNNAQVKTTKLNWNEAKTYCKKLTLAGHNDWRLPNIKELQGIIDIKRYKPAIKKGFKNTASVLYWSASEHVWYAKKAWSVHFKSGRMYSDYRINENYVRCVRHRQ